MIHIPVCVGEVCAWIFLCSSYLLVFVTGVGILQWLGVLRMLSLPELVSPIHPLLIGVVMVVCLLIINHLSNTTPILNE